MADDQSIEVSVGNDGLNIGAAITQKLTEQIQNMDVMSVLQRLIASSPEDAESEDARQKLQAVIEQFNSMDEVQRTEFTKKIKEGLANKIIQKLQDPNVHMSMQKLEEAIGDAILNQIYMYAAIFVVAVVLIVFFGYKLYKSLKEKEKRREEKKKAKQMKKKK